MASFRPRYVAMITAALCAGIYGVGQMKDLKTPGMQNIENRHSSAGGSGTHTPAAASPMGRADLKEGKQDTQKGASMLWPSLLGRDVGTCPARGLDEP